MTPPVLPEQALAPLRAIVEAGLVHQAILETETRVRQPNGEYTTAWVAQEPVDALLTVAGALIAQVAAAQGIKAQWALKLPAEVVVTPGMRALVSGENDAGLWQRLVLITSDRGLTTRMSRPATAVDADLNQ